MCMHTLHTHAQGLSQKFDLMELWELVKQFLWGCSWSGVGAWSPQDKQKEDGCKMEEIKSSPESTNMSWSPTVWTQDLAALLLPLIVWCVLWTLETSLELSSYTWPRKEHEKEGPGEGRSSCGYFAADHSNQLSQLLSGKCACCYKWAVASLPPSHSHRIHSNLNKS